MMAAPGWYRPRPRWPGRLAATAAILGVLALAMCTSARSHELKGTASLYWKPQRVACPGFGRFNPSAMTAAHKTLPCGTRVEVTSTRNGKTVVVTITDRGPYRRGRIIDLSRSSARLIGITGLGPVTLRVLKTGTEVEDATTFAQRWHCVAAAC